MSISMYGVPGTVYAPKSNAQYLADPTTGLITGVADKDRDDLSDAGCVGAVVVSVVSASAVVTSVGGRTGAVVLWDGVIGSVTPATGEFTTVDGTVATFTTVDGIVGSVTPAAGTFTTVGGTIGTFSSSINGVVGGVTPAAGTFTTVGGTVGTFSTSVNGVLGAVTPAAATVTSLTATAYVNGSVGNGLTAIGANRGGALQLAKQFNNVTTAATGTGVLLPVGVVGMEIWVFVDGGVAAAAVQVYASGSETIDTVTGSTGVPLTKGLRAIFKFVAANTWISAQLGVISA